MMRVWRPLHGCFVPWTLSWHPEIHNDNALTESGNRLDYREGRYVRAYQ